MKILKVETYPLFYAMKTPYGDANGMKNYRSCYMIRIITESGYEGWGECVDWLPALEHTFHNLIIPYLIGQKALDRNRITQTLGKWHPRAAACVNMALSEISAVKAGISMCDVWGGAYRDSIPVYASFQSYTDGDDWIARSLQGINQALEEGFTQIKVKIGGKSLGEDQKYVKGIQDQFHDQLDIALDANQSYDFATACRWQKTFSEWSNLLWLEEPMPLHQVAEYKMLRSFLSIPISGGENLKSVHEIVSLLTKQSLDIIQPDPEHLGGIDAFLLALQLSRQIGIRVSPHTYDGALSRLYAVLAQACLAPWTKMLDDLIEPVEWDVMDNPLNQIVQIQRDRDHVLIPQGIGIGVQIDQELLHHYLWDGSSYTP